MAKTIGQLDLVTTFNPSTDEFVIEQSGQTFKVAASVVRGGLVDADIDAAAAIVYSKLDLDDSIVAGDLTADAVTTAKILDANVTPAKLSQPYTLATAQASTSGTSIDFTGIPSWAKRITVMFSSVSTSGSSNVLVQLGTSAGITSTGYASTSGFVSSVPSANASSSTVGFLIFASGAGISRDGVVSVNLLNGNTYVSTQNLIVTDGVNAIANTGAGVVALASALTQVRITTVNGTDTFDAGTINISYEG